MSALRRQDCKQHNEQAACSDRCVRAERSGANFQLNKDNDTENRSVGLKQGLYKTERGNVLRRVGLAI